jgi:hypothetical protein
LVPVGLLLAAACSPAIANVTVCTAIFSYVSVVPLDSAGAQVLATFVVTDSVLRTGKILSIPQQGYPAGSATIFSDNNVADVSQTGDSVLVTGTSGSRKFSATYQFGTDGCHIRRIAGPDTVTVR